MKSASKIPWAQLGFESVLIVVSILVAFSIDSWWENRQEAVEEQRLLAQLKVEFEANVQQLDEKRARHVEAMDAGFRILAATGPNADVRGLNIDAMQADLMNVFFKYTFDPQAGVLSSVIYSGKLDLIDSEELRTYLASWPARYEDLLEDEDSVVAMASNRLTVHYDNFLVLRDISPALSDAAPSQFSADVNGLLRERRFENAISAKVGRTAGLLGFYDETRSQLMHTLSLIEASMR